MPKERRTRSFAGPGRMLYTSEPTKSLKHVATSPDEQVR